MLSANCLKNILTKYLLTLKEYAVITNLGTNEIAIALCLAVFVVTFVHVTSCNHISKNVLYINHDILVTIMPTVS